MPAPKGNQNAKGNKGGRGGPSKYKREYCEIARKLCVIGFTDRQLAEFFEVTEKTIIQWRMDRVEFATAVKAGKDETDDEVERDVLKGIKGYYVEHEETIIIDGQPAIRTVKKWIPGNPGVGMRWLAVRRPEIYREKSETTHKHDGSEVFLKLLEKITEKGKRERIEHKQLLIDRANAVEAEVARGINANGSTR